MPVKERRMQMDKNIGRVYREREKKAFRPTVSKCSSEMKTP